VKTHPLLTSTHNSSYTVWRVGHRSGALQEEDARLPLEPVTPPVTLEEFLRDLRHNPEAVPPAHVRGPVGTLALQALLTAATPKPPAWTRHVSPATVRLCLAYLRYATPAALRRHPQDLARAERLYLRLRRRLQAASWWPPRAAKRGRHTVAALTLLLSHQPHDTAVCLSTAFGAASGRLKACISCGAPFLAPQSLTARLRCERCGWPRLGRIPLTPQQRQRWRRLKQRVYMQILRGTVTREAGLALLRRARVDLRRLQWPSWVARYDLLTRRPRGRPRRSSTPLASRQRQGVTQHS
jgi:hypothetical protein